MVMVEDGCGGGVLGSLLPTRHDFVPGFYCCRMGSLFGFLVLGGGAVVGVSKLVV